MTDIRLIKTEEDYKEALKLADELFDAKADTPEGDKLEVIVTLIENYENEHFPMEISSTLETDNF